jgi:hypothetical protein
MGKTSPLEKNARANQTFFLKKTCIFVLMKVKQVKVKIGVLNHPIRTYTNKEGVWPHPLWAQKA